MRPIPPPHLPLPAPTPTHPPNQQTPPIYADQQTEYKTLCVTNCSGHGQCDITSGVCSCFYSDTLGYWRGEKCELCESGYSGPLCAVPCPGGACNRCNGRGTCNDGIAGNGTCSCFANLSYGFWGGSSCDTCQPGYCPRWAS